jgi:nitroimidazol reductase NimA-like FMN-containing flavoprotein (pyridoxamine 5'-phosphate oxidase superfamily)
MVTSTSATLPVTSRTRLGRYPVRGSFDRAAIHAILDEGFVCHVAFVAGGQPFCVPTGYGRAGDVLYLHGSAASRMMGTLAGGVDVCVTVTLVDGLVLARSAFHHSMNYRSVMVFGRARPVEEPGEKTRALTALTNHIVPDRWDGLRPVTEQELGATTVLALPIEEASAKVRSGPPKDDAEDATWPVWAGVVPVGVRIGDPAPDGGAGEGVAAFDVAALRRVRASVP